MCIRGWNSIIQHSEGEKHVSNLRAKLDPLQLVLQTTSSSNPEINLISRKDQVLKAELIWAMNNVIRDMSAASCNGIANIFNAMFPGEVSAELSLGETKVSYLITEALSPHFRKDLLRDIGSSYLALLYDETTNAKGAKELNIMIRYWSETEERVSVRHLQSFFIGHAKAEDLHQHLLQALKDANLDLRQVLMLGSDGPNVNKKVWRLFDSEVRTVRRDRGLSDIGTCNIHIVHNAFLKGLDHHGSKVSDFAI